MVGKTLAHYEILEPLGAGGMGEVYRARDTQLDRDVAIKVLPEDFATDQDRLARFEREAKLLASLNHANIATIHGLEESDGVRFIAMELVEGDTLAERLATQGRIEVDEALEIAHQITEALEAAHENGVIHRDLKPANVKVTPDGKVKVLDFGLAKHTEGHGGDESDLTHSPTVTVEGTRTGVIMGTAAYMSPEQARGKPVDKRADIWAFGCVLFEMLVGRPPFSGDGVQETLAAVLRDEPDWRRLPPGTPTTVRLLLPRCMRKDPNRRLHDIADARIEMEEALSEPLIEAATTETVGVGASLLRGALPWALALLGLVGGSLAVWISTRSSSSLPASPVRFSETLPGTETLGFGAGPALAISTDGTKLVYVVRQGVNTQLHLRQMDQLQAGPIVGTEGAGCPFFSPDGEWVGFFADGQLKILSLAGGAPVTVAPLASCRGASWGTDGTIIYTPSDSSGLWRISSTPGSKPEPLTLRPDREINERSYRWPQFIPEAGAVIFTVAAGDITSFDEAHVAVLSLDSGEHRTLTQGSYGRYVATGHLVFARSGSVLVVPFDLARLRVTGSPTPIVDNVITHPITGAAQFAVSGTGTLAYVPGSVWEAERTLVWVDRTGKVEPVTEARSPFLRVDISPDGSHLAAEIQAATNEIWISEMARVSLVRLTFGWENRWPIWTPDGGSITFSSQRTGFGNLFQKGIAPGGLAKQLTVSDHEQRASAWGPDGKVLLFSESDPSTGQDIWMLRVGENAEPEPLIRTPYDEYGAVLSPDGRWLAYVSNESGQSEVYVRPFPDMDWQRLISSDGGAAPLWGPDSRELFYWSGTALMRVAISTQPEFGAPEMLFEQERVLPPRTGSYDIAPDGERFLMIEGERERSARQINVVLNWFEELKRLAPSGQSP